MNFNRLKESVKKHEGYRAKVYKDTLGYDTIGYGFAVKDLILDQDIASILLERKLIHLMTECYSSFPWLSSVPNDIKEVVVEMCYQLGVKGFSKFRKTIALLNSGDYIMASEEMLDSKWAVQTPNRAIEMSKKVRDA
jgi:lysozyme